MLNAGESLRRDELPGLARDRLDADLLQLQEQLASREDACARLAARNVELAEAIGRQALELASFRQKLVEAETSAQERFSETATLSRMLLDRENELLAALQSVERERDAVARRHAELDREREHLATSLQSAERERDVAARRYEELDREHRRVVALYGHALAQREQAMQRLQQAISLLRQAKSEVAGRSNNPLLGFVRGILRRLGLLPGTILSMPDIQDPEEQAISVIGQSGLFDEAWYVVNYPESTENGLDALRHYVFHGAAAGLNPSPWFDTTGYLARYPDVCQSGMNPLLHYAAFGRQEGRSPAPLGEDE